MFSFSTWFTYVSENDWILAIILLLFGIFTCFAGKEFFSWVIAGLGAILGFLGTMIIMSLFGCLDGETWLVIVTWVSATVVALILGYLLYRTGAYIGAMAICGVGGFFLGELLYDAVFTETDSEVVLFVCILGVIGALIYFAKKNLE